MQLRKLRLVGITVMGICAASAMAQAGGDAAEPGGPPGPHGGHGRLIRLLIHSTDLMPDQQAQVHQILDTNRAALMETVGQLRQAKSDLADMLLGPQAVGTDAVSAQLARVAELKQQLAQSQTATVLAIRAILTPEQLAKAAAAKEEMQARHHGHCRADAT